MQFAPTYLASSLLLGSLLLGCGSEVRVDGDETDPEPDPPDCSNVGAPAPCAPGWVEVSSCEGQGPDCIEQGGSCGSRTCVPVEQCAPAPSCGPDIEVDDCGDDPECYPVMSCGQTIYCTTGGNCLAAPVCNQDQEEVPSCDGYDDCEAVSICGSTIYCVDVPPGCPLEEPMDGTGCGDALMSAGVGYVECEYATSPSCFSIVACDGSLLDPTWMFVGGGCDE